MNVVEHLRTNTTLTALRKAVRDRQTCKDDWPHRWYTGPISGLKVCRKCGYRAPARDHDAELLAELDRLSRLARVVEVAAGGAAHASPKIRKAEWIRILRHLGTEQVPPEAVVPPTLCGAEEPYGRGGFCCVPVGEDGLHIGGGDHVVELIEDGIRLWPVEGGAA